MTSGIPEPQPLTTNLIESTQIPPNILRLIQPGIEDLKHLGFEQIWYHTLKESLIGGICYGVQGLHKNHNIVGKVLFTSYGTRQTLALVFASELKDETIFVSTNLKPQFNAPSGYIVERRVGAKAADLFQAHVTRLDALANTIPSRSINNFDDIAALDYKMCVRAFADKLERGIWVEMSDDEVVLLRRARGL